MEIFSHTHATSYGRTYADSDEAYLQESLEPADRLTNKEIQQIRSIREEIESRTRLTRFEARYICVLKTAEEKSHASGSNLTEVIKNIRNLLNDAERANSIERRSILIAFLVALLASHPQ